MGEGMTVGHQWRAAMSQSAKWAAIIAVTVLAASGCAGVETQAAPTVTPAAATTPGPSARGLDDVKTIHEALVALKDHGVTCLWDLSTESSTARCSSPKVWVFVDPAPHLGPELMGSTFTLYQAAFVGKGGLVYRGDNWVIGAETSQAPAIMKAMGY